jgi:hypothetical protein
MGMEQTVVFAKDGVPAWTAVSDLLDRRGFPVHVRMIDNELAMPGEFPQGSWNELRVGTPQGMITVRRESDRVRCITWGNADGPLVQAWNAVAWAFADAGGGRVMSPDGPRNADDFEATADLPVVLRGNDGAN